MFHICFYCQIACVCLHFHPIPLERAWNMNRIGNFGDSLPIESGFTYTAAVLFCLSLIFWCRSPFIFRFCAQKIDNVYTVKVFLISEALVKILFRWRVKSIMNWQMLSCTGEKLSKLREASWNDKCCSNGFCPNSFSTRDQREFSFSRDLVRIDWHFSRSTLWHSICVSHSRLETWE